jgi:nucleotide-binding universal stress UspA family protein
MWNKILIANDGSEDAMEAVRTGLRLAKQLGSEIHIISIEEELPLYAATVGEVEEAERESNGYFQKLNKEISEFAESLGVKPIMHIIRGHAVEKVVKFATDEKFDLLIIGFMGHSKIFGRVMGSTAQNLIRLSPCTTLVVKVPLK